MQSFQSTLQDVDSTIQTINRRLTPITTSLENTLSATRSLVGHLDQQAENVANSTNLTLSELQLTLKLAQGSLRQLNEGSPLSEQLTETLRELSASARSVRYLADEVRQQPQSILFGKGAAGGNH